MQITCIYYMHSKIKNKFVKRKKENYQNNKNLKQRRCGILF